MQTHHNQQRHFEIFSHFDPLWRTCWCVHGWHVFNWKKQTYFYQQGPRSLIFRAHYGPHSPFGWASFPSQDRHHHNSKKASERPHSPSNLNKNVCLQVSEAKLNCFLGEHAGEAFFCQKYISFWWFYQYLQLNVEFYIFFKKSKIPLFCISRRENFPFFDFYDTKKFPFWGFYGAKIPL